jgi:hypothetical protein
MDGSPLAKDSLSLLHLLVGAALYPTCRYGLPCAQSRMSFADGLGQLDVIEHPS